jgi:two-component system alkaline phosphatase synthesis response regulator PhoP
VARDHRTILVVDDDAIVLHVLERDLVQAGFNVLTAVNGKEALDIVVRELVDIIVSDISMPEMDGLEFCARIRQSPEHVDIPFIFLTVHGGEGERTRGLRSGADDYLVKPFKSTDLIDRAEILYDRIQRRRSVSTFEGNLADVSLCDILQLLELTRKQGILHVEAPTGRGTLGLSDGTLMNAVWNDLHGEDAVFEMFALHAGSFRFQAKDVSPGNLGQPIGFVLMEIARLTDELATFKGHVPPGEKALRLLKPFDGDDTDAQLVCGAIKDGCADLTAIRDRVRMADVRLRLAIGRLVGGGFVAAQSGSARDEFQRTAGRAGAKPTKILIAFTDHGILSNCLSLLADSADPPTQPGSLSDFSRVTLASCIYDIVCLRGEKRFAFMWELVLKTSEGAVFLLKTEADAEHAAFFSARAAAFRKPVVRVCLAPGLSGDAGVQVLTTRDDMLHVLSSLRLPAT